MLLFISLLEMVGQGNPFAHQTNAFVIIFYLHTVYSTHSTGDYIWIRIYLAS